MVIIVVSDDGFAVTTYGRTRAICQRLGEWSESDSATRAIMEIFDA
jgi:hypothetical protein